MNVHKNNSTMQQEMLTDFLVFKTNVRQLPDVEKLRVVLDAPGILQWNIDHQDVDHVLRVKADDWSPAEIIAIVQRAGYKCEELPD
ncbi:MAG TPA: hypothetical protein VEB86_16630 [Chryseosolibacter sp.]|nr:hypothetical protein [Chryseosolibacter sp.]